jgi:large subunit ribosomal protein L15
MKLNEIADNPGSRKNRTRIGRGIGSGTGKTGGRGGKGQTARSGVRIKGFEGGQMPLHRRLPKRGFNNIFALRLTEMNLGRVQAAIDAGKLEKGADVDAAVLVNAGILRRSRDGVRLLGGGELTAKVNFSVHGASKSAIAAVEKAGGTVKIIAVPKEVKEPRGKNVLRAMAEARGDKPAAKAKDEGGDAPAAKAKAPKAEQSAEKSEKPKAEKPKADKPKAEKPAAKSDKKPKA